MGNRAVLFFMCFLIVFSCSKKEEKTFKENNKVVEKIYLPFDKGKPNVEKYKTLLGDWDIKEIIITKYVNGKQDLVSKIEKKDTTIHITISKEGIFNKNLKIGESYGVNSTLFTLKLDTFDSRYFVMGKDIDKRGYFILQSPGVKYLKNGQQIATFKSRLYLVRRNK